MKSIIVSDPKPAYEASVDLLSRRFPNKPDKAVFKRRDFEGFGFEIYATKKDKSEVIVLRLKKTGPARFPRLQIDYDQTLLTFQ